MPKLVSVIIEWENAKLSDLERAERMLAQLGRQMAEASARRGLIAELLVLYDSEAVDPAVPGAAIETQIDAAAWPGTIQLIAAPGQRYYEQKNKGARLSSGDILIFLDSDIVPDEGWLEGLLAALDNPAVGVVGGEAYHATETYRDRIFAAFWRFPTRRTSRGLYRHTVFYANNVGFRREIFLVHPFPAAASYRGQCTELSKTLRRHGIPIYRQGDSAVSHPPPETAGACVVRALCEGHDAVYWKSRRTRFGLLLSANPAGSLLRLVRELWKVAPRVIARSRAVGLGPFGVLAAIAAGSAYAICKLAGEVVSFFAPGVIRRNVSI